MNITTDKDLRMKVLAKTTGHCAYCGKALCSYDEETLRPEETWHIDHMMPQAQGGDDSIDNLIASCSTCNRSKHDKTPDEFRHALESRLSKHINLAGQTIYDDPWLGNAAKRKAINHLMAADKAIGDASVTFYADSLDDGILLRDEYPEYGEIDG